jgi:hypothetical protein
MVALLLGALVSTRAETLVDLTFEDHHSLLRSHPDGLSEIPPALTARTATLAAGTGGRAIPHVVAGRGTEGTADVRFLALSEPALGGKPFVRTTLESGGQTRQAGLTILVADNALDALVTRQGPAVHLDGVIDFLFRPASDTEFPNVLITTKLAHLGIQAGVDPKDGKLFLLLDASAKLLDLDADGAADQQQMERRSGGSLTNDAIAHGALLFRTAADGTLTVSFLVGEGPGPIDPSSTLSVTVEGLRLLDLPGKSGTDRFTIALGPNEVTRQTLDLAAFRVLRPAPPILPAFPTP